VLASLSIANYSGPTAHGGGWNDMCLLLNPGFSDMTKEQHRSQFNMWYIHFPGKSWSIAARCPDRSSPLNLCLGAFSPPIFS
jgi:hypothetical protein